MDDLILKFLMVLSGLARLALYFLLVIALLRGSDKDDDDFGGMT